MKEAWLGGGGVRGLKRRGDGLKKLAVGREGSGSASLRRETGRD